MKAYTDVNRSKQLADILPIESADMRYTPFSDSHPWVWDGGLIEKDSIPCWSLASLMAQMPCASIDTSRDGHCRAFWHEMYSGWYDNPIDACVELIERVRKEEEG